LLTLVSASGLHFDRILGSHTLNRGTDLLFKDTTARSWDHTFRKEDNKILQLR
jgi:hypothetical protein